MDVFAIGNKTQEIPSIFALIRCTGKGNGDDGCQAQLSVSNDDCYLTMDESYDQPPQTFITIRCPICGAETDINDRIAKPLNVTAIMNKEAGRKKFKRAITARCYPVTDIAITIAKSHIVLIKRAIPPYQDKYALPGGHVEAEETSVVACVREAEEEIGFKCSPKELKLLAILDDPHRDPRYGRRISPVFTINLPDKPPHVQRLEGCQAASDAKSMEIMELAELTPDMLAFDHWHVIAALKKRFRIASAKSK